MFGVAGRLRKRGVLGLNQRNLDFISELNSRRLYPKVDDKYLTKKLAQKAGLAVPELYGVIEFQGQVENLSEIVANRPGFVIKPSRGSGGEGVLVITKPVKHSFRRSSGSLMSEDELKYHTSRTLTGIYSLDSQPDKALIEYRVRSDPIFTEITYLGVPDIRIIVCLGIPVMAMVRLPTRMSDGKANLHQGAVGAGINMATGETLPGVWQEEVVHEHPDTGNIIAGLTIPDWDNLLDLATRTYELTGLGYQGVDIVLDKHFGALLLELNARPGLNIQIANREGLLNRLQLAQKYHKDLKGHDAIIRFAKENFGA